MGQETGAEETREHHNGWLSFILDFGPLLAFFLAYQLGKSDSDPFQGILVGTITFMVGITIAIIASIMILKKVTPMQWISAVLVLGFGGLTVYLHDPVFIQIKPTIIYTGFAALLLGGYVRGHAMLKYALGPAMQGLTDEGWIKLSRNWGLFFVFMALTNEALRYGLTFEMWLTVKTWGLTILALAFNFTQIPLMLRHGFGVEEATEPAIPPGTNE